MTQISIQRRPASQALLFCFLNWIIPGLGYYLSGDRNRGIQLFILITGCFLIGVLWGGFILSPAWVGPRHPEFNLVLMLSYIVQVFNGIGWGILSFLHSISDDEALFGIISMSSRSYSDLGQFHLIVSGALNYFATVRLYDLLAGNQEIS